MNLQIFAYLYICAQPRTLFLDFILDWTSKIYAPAVKFVLSEGIASISKYLNVGGMFFQDSKQPQQFIEYSRK